jgi:3D (Asp-Asp-Asp) domain-containing protein
MMRKMLILASLAAIVGMGAPAAEAETTPATTPFVDIGGHWAENEIENLYIAGGVERADRFRPDEPVTRGELIAMFLKAKGIKPVADDASPFADVPRDSWLAPYAETAYRLGIIHGRKEGGRVYLHPDKPVQREELVSILTRATGDSGKVNQLGWTASVKTLQRYPDGGAVEEVFQRPFVYALQNGLVGAYPDGTLQPNKPMTRAEAATYAALHLLPDKANAAQQRLAKIGTPYVRMLTVQTTAYSYPTDDVFSYLGYPLRKGVVAVDPNVIPLGSHLYIDGYGYAVAADIGGAVKQRHVDLFLPTLREAANHGLQKDVRVYILD